VVFVLLFPHQLGHFLGDGIAQRWSRGAASAMVLGGLGGLVVLTNPPLFRLAGHRRFDWFDGIGHYQRSMLGTDVETVSNAYPPTLCFLLAVLALWPLGFGQEQTPTIRWWWERFVWVGAPGVILVGLVVAFGWAEDLARRSRRRAR
jgi:hypothetical protein